MSATGPEANVWIGLPEDVDDDGNVRFGYEAGVVTTRRGWEVRHSFFTDQFDDASLVKDARLDRTIDNISGATLSVRAVTRLARVALLLDQAVTPEKAAG